MCMSILRLRFMNITDLLVQWWESETRILVWFGPWKQKNARVADSRVLCLLLITICLDPISSVSCMLIITNLKTMKCIVLFDHSLMFAKTILTTGNSYVISRCLDFNQHFTSQQSTNLYFTHTFLIL